MLMLMVNKMRAFVTLKRVSGKMSVPKLAICTVKAGQGRLTR